MVAPMLGLVAALFTRTSSAPSCSTRGRDTGCGLVRVARVRGEGGHPRARSRPRGSPPAASSRPSCLRDESITAAPAVGERRGDRPADALRRPGDQRDLAVEFSTHEPAVSRATMGRWPEWQHRTESRPSTHPPRLGYIPALDGLRALAVVAVLLYHADQRWIPGGFLGVDVFFVISGYLITCLLLVRLAADRRHRAQAVLVPAGPPPPARAVRHALRGVALRDPLPPRRARPAAGRGDRRAALRRELVPHLPQPLVLPERGPPAAAPARVVAGGGGAVLPVLAADPRCSC